MIGSRMKSGREFQTVGPATEKSLTAVSVLQAVDGWWNADAAECQHRRLGRNSPTDTVVRGRSDTVELSLPA